VALFSAAKFSGANGSSSVTFLLILLCEVKSEFDQTWYEWYMGNGLQSCRAEFEYLHKLW